MSTADRSDPPTAPAELAPAPPGAPMPERDLSRRQRRELRELRRHELREATRRRRAEARLRAREVAADWLMIAGGVALLASLFLPWSHQFSPSVLARYGHSAVLGGIPRSPDAWQVYSIVDVLLALLAVTLAVVAFTGRRPARILTGALAVLGIAFVAHALSVPPTDGANLVDRPTAVRYLADAPSSGSGELVALAGLAVALGGIAVSLTVE